ncbi:MAG: phosphoribosylformylglycinamidine cyclo-ligase [Candidatus Tectomicrobia bacterium]|uniref:Phosphoribosylformylglycinamidine cyclo-ligase n=1 Tax=Tectimicrobiota bacterium TaxID=2528274 RepID=A0A932MNU9_UNCTE|nr:phosphoribosylformylglycinamidine cyclo-ligase [Candidatus Tectomicrobia bacterium]
MDPALDPKPALTYQAAGVDVEAGDRFVRAISRSVRSTREGRENRIPPSLADFAGLFRLPTGLKEPILVSGTDGVGTKLLVAQRLGRHGTVGIDLVAMCVNDVLTTGAAPLFFLDYLATGKLEAEILAAVVEGVAEGCRRAGCVLLGGETAEMPGVYEPGVYDLAGFAVGVVDREESVDGGAVREGDVLLGLSSSGLHSNGYSLVRRILTDPSEWERTEPHPELGRPLGAVLLEPTRIYARAVAAIRGNGGVHGMAHITGGGLPGNVCRILPEGLQARFEAGSWPEPPIFGLLARRGPVARAEMFRTFNMGLGWVVAAEASKAQEIEDALVRTGEAVHRAGRVVRRGAGEPPVTIAGERE